MTSDHLSTLLTDAQRILDTLGEGFHESRETLIGLGRRLSRQRFHLAVLGQFKRGKSTLLNALLGEPVLPVSVLPLTAVPTFLEAGPERRACVTFADGTEEQSEPQTCPEALAAFLSRFVAEENNPKNQRGVVEVHVFHPAPVLDGGLVLIDTPGIGSTFRHNSEATLNFLPQCDAALFLVSADPPLTEVELSFLQVVQEKTARLFFVFNKVDYLNESDREDAVQFFRKVLTEQVGLPGEPTILPVSARQGLEARLAEDDAGWTCSGLAALEIHLQQFLVSDKQQALAEAVARKAAATVADALLQLRLVRRSLELPLAELERRLALFDEKLAEAERQRREAQDLLAGDRNRTLAELETHASKLRRRATAFLTGLVEKTAAGTPDAQLNEDTLQETLAEAIPGLFEHELGETTRAFEHRLAEVREPHRRRATKLIEGIRHTAADLFDIPSPPLQPAHSLDVVRRPYWVTHRWTANFSPVGQGLADRFLPAAVRRRRMIRRFQDNAVALVMSNVENLRWATYQSINETFRSFGTELDERLQETIAATRGAARAALERRRVQAAAAAPELSRLRDAEHRLESVHAVLNDWGSTAPS